MEVIVFLICVFPFSKLCQYCRIVGIWYLGFQFHIALYKFQRSLCYLIFMTPIDISVSDRNSHPIRFESDCCFTFSFWSSWKCCLLVLFSVHVERILHVDDFMYIRTSVYVQIIEYGLLSSQETFFANQVWTASIILQKSVFRYCGICYS